MPSPSATPWPSAGLRRPQRDLTPADYETIRSTKLLNLHGALILGIVDPVPNPSPMSEDEGTWVREHVWPAHYRDIEDRYPWGFARWTNCERGTCRACLGDRCDQCVHRVIGGPNVDDNTDHVTGLTGNAVARFIPRPGGEPCVWWCRCPCPKDGPAPTVPRPAPDDHSGAPVRTAPAPSLPGRDAAQPTLF